MIRRGVNLTLAASEPTISLLDTKAAPRHADIKQSWVRGIGDTQEIVNSLPAFRSMGFIADFATRLRPPPSPALPDRWGLREPRALAGATKAVSTGITRTILLSPGNTKTKPAPASSSERTMATSHRCWRELRGSRHQANRS